MFTTFPSFMIYVVLLLIVAFPIVQGILVFKRRERWVWFLLPLVSIVVSLIRLGAFFFNRTLAEYTLGEGILTVVARLFVYNILTLILLGIIALKRSKRVGFKVLLVLLMLAIIPFPLMANDGGTVVYNATLYRITFLHRMDDTRPSGFRDGTYVDVFPFNYMRELR